MSIGIDLFVSIIGGVFGSLIIAIILYIISSKREDRLLRIQKIERTLTELYSPFINAENTYLVECKNPVERGRFATKAFAAAGFGQTTSQPPITRSFESRRRLRF